MIPATSAHRLLERAGRYRVWQVETDGRPNIEAPVDQVNLVCDGRTRYKFDRHGQAVFRQKLDKWTPFQPAALPDGGFVHAPGGKGLQFFDPAGHEISRWGEDQQMLSIRPAVDGQGQVYVGVDGPQGSRLVVLSKDGEELESHPLPHRSVGVPVLGPHGEVVLRTVFDEVVRVDGDNSWTRKLPERLNSPLTVGPDGNIWAGNSEGRLFKLDPKGESSEVFRAKGEIRGRPLAGANGRIYVTSFDHHLYALEPDGKVVFSADCGDFIEGGAHQLADGTLMVGAGKQLLAFDDRGHKLWSEVFPHRLEQPIEGPGGLVLVPGADGLAAVDPRGLAALLDPEPARPGVEDHPEWLLVGDVALDKQI
ncbi:MAG: PQQ-binding-like beta-propeller repeat protein [Vulcanimicrobiota bacterium]